MSGSLRSNNEFLMRSTPTDASPDSAIAVTADNLEFTLDVQMPSFGVEWAVG